MVILKADLRQEPMGTVWRDTLPSLHGLVRDNASTDTLSGLDGSSGMLPSRLLPFLRSVPRFRPRTVFPSVILKW